MIATQMAPFTKSFTTYYVVSLLKIKDRKAFVTCLATVIELFVAIILTEMALQIIVQLLP